MRYIILASLLFSCISAEITTHDTQETTQNDYNGGVECGLCLWGTEKIEDYLEANYTETKLENEMTALCNDIPGQFGELCQQLIVPNIPVIIEKMEEKETPDTICQQLHACDSVDAELFHQFYSSPHLYSLMMFYKQQLEEHPMFREYMHNTINRFCI